MDSNSHVPKIEQDIILREFYYTPSGYDHRNFMRQ